MSPCWSGQGRPDPGFPRVSGDEPGSSLTYQNINEFSRMSGDEPSQKVFWTSIREFSPHERG